MSLPIYARPMYFGPIGINATVLAVASAVFLIAVCLKIKQGQTKLFELTLLLFLLGFVFQTFHGIIIVHIFPISLPERPLFDNGLTLNYALTNLIAYTAVPILAIFALNRRLTVDDFGFRVSNWKRTVAFSAAGLVFASAFFLATDFFFHQQWVQGYTKDGMILWILLVSVVSVMLQKVFFVGFLFNRFLGKENVLLLAVIAWLAYQSYMSNSLPWQICSALTFATTLWVTWKTRNVCGACLIAVLLSLIEITLQLL
ncbi:MAG: hypothetical protein NWE93_09050 [Candidatus Bathyarchaeota archaeon]|nr:hypothetical protein [Candidatus Bathyarchaeota archaeon]